MIQMFRKKGFKFLMLAFLIVSSALTAFAMAPKAYAASTTVSIVSNNVTYLYGPDSVKAGNPQPVRMIDRLRDSAGHVVFCINFNKPSPNGLSYNEAERLDNATTYLLNAFYKGNKNLTGNRAYDEYLIQAAIHTIKSPNDFTLTNPSGETYVDKDGSYTTVNKIKALVAEAKKAGNPTVPAFTNTLSVSAMNVTSKRVGDKFISAPVIVNAKGTGTLTASLSNATKGSYLADENGNPIKTIQNGTKITVVTPISDVNGQALQPKVTIKGDFENAYQVAKRLTGQSAYQDIATYGLDSFKEVKTASFTTAIQAEMGSVQGVKVTDAKKPLAGVTMDVYKSTGEKVKSIKTDEKGAWKVDSLPFGHYYWLESATVDGYVLNNVKHPFTISYDRMNANAGEFVNQLMRGQIEVLKIDSATKEPLKNAEFTLTDKNGVTTKKVTGENGKAMFDVEANNVYSVKETKNPTGYHGTFEVKDIVVTKDKQVFSYTAKNTKDVVVKEQAQVQKVQKEKVEVAKVAPKKEVKHVQATKLAKTGDTPMWPYVAAGLLLAVIAVVVLIRQKRKARQ